MEKSKFSIKNIGIAFLLTLIGSTIFVGGYFSALAEFSGSRESLPFYVGAPQPYYAVIDKNSTHFFLFNGTTGQSQWVSTNDDAIIQAAIDNVTLTEGTIYIKGGTYSATVTLKDNCDLILDEGVTGVTIAIDSGADCSIFDNEAGYKQEYVSGSLYTEINFRTTEFWYGGENKTDFLGGEYVESVTENGTQLTGNITFTEGSGVTITQSGNDFEFSVTALSFLPYSAIIFENSSGYYCLNGTTSTIDHYNSDFETLMEWAIDNATDGQSFFITDGDYDLNDEIDDMGKNYITIKSTWGAIINIDNRDNNKHGFVLTNAEGWVFDGLHFEAVLTYDGTAGHESSAIEIQDPSNDIVVKNCLAETLNGYFFRVESGAGEKSYNITLNNNVMLDCGHNFFSGSAVYDSAITNNYLYKSNSQLDSEHIWLSSGTTSYDGAHNCIISGNRIYGGQIAIRVSCALTNDLDNVTNIIITNNYMEKVLDNTTSVTNSAYVSLAGLNIVFSDNIIIHNPSVVTQNSNQPVIDISRGGDTSQNVTGLIMIGNVVEHNDEYGIGAYNDWLEGCVISNNVIRGTPTGETSLLINQCDFSNICYNIGARSITIDTNAGGNSDGNIADCTAIQ